MSPSEFDLRAALRDGEGDATPDVDAVIARASGIARRRRTVFLTASAAAIVVALGGTGLALRDTGKGRSTAASAQHKSADYASGGGAVLNVPAASQSPIPAPASAPRAGLSGSQCPPSPKKYLVPGGGGTGQFGGTEPLFAKPVAKLIVCDYSRSTLLGARELTGAAATDLVQSMESSATRFGPTGSTVCPPGSEATLDIIATATDGSALPDVTGDVGGCAGATLTNGTAVRFGWLAPSSLLMLNTQSAGLPSGSAPAATMSGSPAH